MRSASEQGIFPGSAYEARPASKPNPKPFKKENYTPISLMNRLKNS
jgi:hypothetical protein